MKRFIAALLVAFMLAGVLSACGKGENTVMETPERPSFESKTPYTELSKEEFVLSAQKGDLKLYFNPATTHFMVENTKDNSVWYSNPQDAEEDEYAAKLTQMQMQSTLIVEYTNVEKNKTTALNLYTASVRSKKYTVNLIDDGVLFAYDVNEIGKTVYFAVRLADGYLTTDVWYESSGENKENVFVSAVSVTPYFVSGKLTDDGYLFVPDGSGALVGFNTDNISSDSYSRPIYGEEATYITRDWYLEAKENGIRLPVIGAVRNGSAVMAVAKTAAELGTVNAFACGQQSSYANAYISYRVLNSVEYDLGTYTTVLYEKNEKQAPTFTTDYYFLTGDDANYSGMARCYREYLKNSYSLSEKGVSDKFYTDIYGGVIKRVSTLGIPHDKFMPLTTAEDLEMIVNSLREKGMTDITVRYRNWNADELSGKRVDGVKADASLGIKKLNSLEGVKVYPAVLSIQTYKKGGFFDALANATYSITGLPFSMKGYTKSNLRENDETTYWVAATKLKENAENVISGVKDKGFSNIALADITKNLYSDYRDNGYMRDFSKKTTLSILERVNQEFDGFMADSANDYAAVYADVIYNAPVSHSSQDILERTVPFYTMVLSPFIECVAPVLNGEQADDELILQVAASGAYAGFAFMSEKSSELLTTELKSLVNMNFDTTVEAALGVYNSLKEIYAAANGSYVYSHEYISDTLTVTRYENGAEVYVNFGTEPVLVSGITVEATSFGVVGGLS